MVDVLAKAAEAVGGYVYERYCSRCRVASVVNCPTCPAEQLRSDDGPDLARAVLEAAGYEEAIALVEELRQWVYSDCASIVLYGPEDCQHCAYRKACKLPGLAERIQAALARAGKEVA